MPQPKQIVMPKWKKLLNKIKKKINQPRKSKKRILKRRQLLKIKRMELLSLVILIRMRMKMSWQRL